MRELYRVILSTVRQTKYKIHYEAIEKKHNLTEKYVISASLNPPLIDSTFSVSNQTCQSQYLLKRIRPQMSLDGLVAPYY